MSDHDPLCPTVYLPGEGGCRCALIARVRADERRMELLSVCECGCMERDAHAEAVAAKLVEVIRVDDLRLRTQKGHTAQARRERDAARAERLEALQKVAALDDQLAAARAEVAALQVLAQDANEAFAAGRREVLADLRAKVDECSTVGEVLALIDGAGQ